MDECRMLPSVSNITAAFTHITELCQQVFIYNEEAHCTSHTSCVQVLELPQSHFDDNQAMSTVPYSHLASSRFRHFVWCGCICICKCSL